MKTVLNIIFLNLVCILSLNAQCFEADETIWLNTWASCQTSQNPKSEYGNSHWIQYDFGETRKLSKSWVWNTNDPSKLNQGFNQVKIDYSLDGSTWTYWGEMNFPMAQGEAVYGGFPGPDLMGIDARYVLLTAISNHGSPSCSGIAEIKFNLYPDLIYGVFNDDVLDCEEGFFEGVYVGDITNTAAGFYWPFDVGPGLEFTFEYRALGESTWTMIEGLDEMELYLEFLEPGTTYEFRVRADCNGEIITSEIGSFTTTDEPLDCDRVEDIWLVEATENTATIEWEAPGDEEYFYIRYGLASAPYLEEEAESETTSIFLDELQPFTEYALRVAVFCDDDQFNYSDEFIFMTGATSTNNVNASENYMRLFPNPTPGGFSMEYYSEIADQLNYTVTDITGKVLQQNSTRVAPGINIQRVDLSNLPNGIYLVNTQAQQEGIEINEKIVKVNR